MGRVVGATPALHALAVFLLLPLGQSWAAGWEDGIVLEGDSNAAGISVLGEEPAPAVMDPPRFDELPVESVPLSGPPGTGGVAPSEDHWEHPQPACQPAPNSCPATPAHPDFIPCEAAPRGASWTFRSDALLLWRNAPASRPIFSSVVRDTDTLGATALDADDLNSDVLVAPRLSLFRTGLDGTTFEATYFYAGNFYSQVSLPYDVDGYATSPPGIYGNDWGPPDTNLDSAAAKLLGQLQSLEFNARHCIWPDTCQFLIGARWLQWNETLRMRDTFIYTDPTVVSGKDSYETRCFNNLWGGQIGLDTLLLGRPGTTRVEGLVKAGAYYNAAGQASTYRYVQTDGFTYGNQARDGEPAACSFVGEVGLTAVLPITCNCDFRCGYYGLWLTSLAQPTKQLSRQTINQFGSLAELDTSGALILQGLSLGLESRW